MAKSQFGASDRKKINDIVGHFQSYQQSHVINELASPSVYFSSYFRGGTDWPINFKANRWTFTGEAEKWPQP